MNNAGSVAINLVHRSKVIRIRPSVAAHPHSDVTERTRLGCSDAVASATTAPSE